jgi:hypothetical protein
METHNTAPRKKTATKRGLKWRRYITKKRLIISFFAITGALLASALIFTVVVALGIKNVATTANGHARAAYDSLKNQDLENTKVGLTNVSQDIKTLEHEYAKLSFWRYSPLAWHYMDGVRVINAATAGVDAGHILVDALEPYADVIGFQGQGSFVGGTAEDRIVKIMETLDVVAPTLDEVITKAEYIETQINAINPKRYPFNLNGYSAETVITQVKSGLHDGVAIMADYKPLLEQLSSIAGVETPKRYLVMFQNDAEMRPTGGFWTAYAILTVEKGKVFPEKSDDIYDLDNKFRTRLQPPEAYAKYLNVKTWHLRDLNVSPDFKTSVETFLTYYETIPGEPKVDGVIAINTQVLTDLVAVLGDVEVPGYGAFTASIDERCDCPQIIYELENTVGRATPYIRPDRKAILGPMMQTILSKAYGAPKQQWPDLFQSIWRNITQKDVLFYFKDPVAQAAVERVNLAGRIMESQDDYLAVIDTNLGGAKTNLFVSQEINQTVAVTAEGTEKTVEVIYKNPYKGSNCNLEAGQLCLNGVMRDWVRFYVPAGAKLTDSMGFEKDTVKMSEDLGKSVIEGFLIFPPESQKRVSITYTIPYAPTGTYRLLHQKQSGSGTVPVTLTVNDGYIEYELNSDQTLSVPF